MRDKAKCRKREQSQKWHHLRHILSWARAHVATLVDPCHLRDWTGQSASSEGLSSGEYAMVSDWGSGGNRGPSLTSSPFKVGTQATLPSEWLLCSSLPRRQDEVSQPSKPPCLYTALEDLAILNVLLIVMIIGNIYCSLDVCLTLFWVFCVNWLILTGPVRYIIKPPWGGEVRDS